MFALVRKEFQAFFSTLLGYVVVSMFLLLNGLFLWVFPGETNVFDAGQASLESFFVIAPWVLMIIVPAITMRSFSEEYRTGTMELLATKPIRPMEIVGAKFLGAFSVLLFALLPTLLFIPIIGWLGQPHWNFDAGAIKGSYLGLVLLCGAFTSIGITVSALSKNPLIAYLITTVVLVFGFIGFQALASFDSFGTWDLVFSQLGISAHYQALSRGLIGSSDLVYFFLIVSLSLLLARFAFVFQRLRSRDQFVEWLLGTAIASVMAWGCSFAAFQLDFTEEKRFTMTEATQVLLESLEEEVFITCYLTGDYPAQWKRLERAIRYQLEDMAALSEGNLRFQFVDIYEIDDRQTIGQNEEKLVEQGLNYSRIAFTESGAQAFKTIWPAALISYQGKTEPVQFFRSEMPEPTEFMIQGSINALEYELSRAMRKLITMERPRIAIVEGHGELSEAETADFVMDLEADYDVFNVRIDGQLNMLSEKIEGMARRLNRFDLAIIAKPDSLFDPKDQLIIDQFVMNGGRVMWLLDPIAIDFDSLGQNGFTMGVTNELGIYDQLFQYGVRFNRNVVVDLQCAPIVMGAGPLGNQKNMQMFNWYYAPVAMPLGTNHPITTNLDPVKFDFASRLDTVDVGGDLRKHVLLSSSEMSREYKAPVRISSNVVELKPDYFSQNNLPNQPLAVLVEGSFESAFKHRLPDTLKTDDDFAFQSKSLPTAQIMIGDGDIIRNQVKEGPNGPMILPLGYDRTARRVVYDNKEFLRNAVSYLLNETAAITVRSRTIALRPLNTERLRLERLGWQAIALALPIGLVLGLGWAFTFRRRRRFAKRMASAA
ncbi:MAG: gliding motility-associated ABC transporter substrate-binding protein GldG [Crocinitomicaceae bacterium]|nr:gliding motility-associated ABC transporter substrate-binding protein GldG [Crocinitomicaceae bacterium]